MEKRLNISKVDAKAYEAMMGFETYLATTFLSPIQQELIKIRASQINGCSYCLDIHTKDALGHGEKPQRLFLISVWRETQLFSDKEMILLAMTEEITLIHQHGLTEETYQLAKKLFDEKQISEIIMAIIAINAWNRIGVSTALPLKK